MGAKTLEELLKNSRPVWAKGYIRVKNQMVGFRKVIAETQKKSIIKIATSSIYRLTINGEFVAHGPAITAHGHYRVDEIDITEYLTKPENVLVIESVSNNINSFYLLDANPFVQAEIYIENELFAATGVNAISFDIFVIKDRVSKVQKYTFQRTFTEVYNIDKGFNEIRQNSGFEFKREEEYVYSRVNLHERHVKYPSYHIIRIPGRMVEKGIVTIDEDKKDFVDDPGILQVEKGSYKGYKLAELEVVSFYEWQKVKTLSREKLNNIGFNSITLSKEYVTAEFDRMYTGFIGTKINCIEDSTVMVVFDEILYNGDVDLTRSNCSCVNVIIYNLKKGEYSLESFEPYSAKVIKVIVTKGRAEIEGLYIREYANNDTQRATFECSNDKINAIFEAGRETYKQNAVDIFTDCPSRERAGWLCDSFFTSRAMSVLSGNTLIEDNFIENFILPDSFPSIPDGMLPMCYPADHITGNYIPNWALWLIPELYEYKDRGGNLEIIKNIEPKIHKLLRFFEKYENEFGLLEGLDRWVFVEWSEANNLVQDVNFPSNMLYYGALKAAGSLYNRHDYLEKAERVKEAIIKLSYNGEFFEDNAIRADGKLKLMGNITEVCQYYAFFFGVATSESYPELWKRLLNNFGPNRDYKRVYPNVHPANAFIGNYLRIDMLSNNREIKKVLNETIDYFYYMAEKTGTLWEDNKEHKSLNHGFASHICYTLVKDILGVKRIDRKNKHIDILINDIDLDYCKGTIPVNEDILKVEWKREEGKVIYNITPPKDYTYSVEIAK